MPIARRFFPKPTFRGTLAELARVSLSEPCGEGEFGDIAPPTEAGPDDISFLTNRRYAKELADSKAGGLILPFAQKDRLKGKPGLLSSNPRLTFAKICAFFYPPRPPGERGEEIPPKIAPGAVIHPSAVVEGGAEIGRGARIGPNSHVGYNCLIGEDANIGSNVAISCAEIGKGAVIQSNCAIGEEGFGFAVGEGGDFFSVPHLGRVIIGERSQIAAGCSVVRGSMGDTIIGENCRIDSLCQIAHNVVLGRGVIVSAQVGISGSTKVGEYARIGGQSGIMGHLNIGAGVSIFPKSGVMADIADGKSVGGSPAVSLRQFLRSSRGK